MTTVLVHGNPESDAVWDLLAQRLEEAGGDPALRLSPPGFGAPVPAGFPLHPDAYRDWLVGELEGLDGPVDLVGHDWGGIHTVNVAMARPDLLRSWASDAIGVFAPDYVWHDLARTWQSPGEGEAWVSEMEEMGTEARAGMLASLGMAHPVADHVAQAFGPEMGRSILTLYRASAQPAMAEAGAGLTAAAARPGLCLVAGDDDTVGTDRQRQEAAERAGAQVARLEGHGHWWMTQAGGRAGAEALLAFWAGL